MRTVDGLKAKGVPADTTAMGDDGWRLGHRPGLDGLRGVAVVLVLVFHWWQTVFPGGDTGVDLFFVLSGFLITRLIAEEVWATGSLDLQAFYVRRIRRLLPASTLLVVSCLAAPGALWVFVYVANWARIDGALGDGPLEHTWSLAVEEQFYLVWPLVLVCLVLRSRRPALLVLGAVLVVGLHRVSLEGASDLRIAAGTDTRIDSMLVGAAVAFVVPTLLRLPVWSWLAAAVTPFLIVVLFDRPDLNGWGYTIIAGAFAVLLLWALDSDGWITSAPLRWLGELSYSLYLWHYPVTWVLRGGDIHDTSAVGTAVAIPVSFALALASHRLVERRFRRPSAVGRRAVEIVAQEPATTDRWSAHDIDRPSAG